MTQQPDIPDSSSARAMPMPVLGYRTPQTKMDEWSAKRKFWTGFCAAFGYAAYCMALSLWGFRFERAGLIPFLPFVMVLVRYAPFIAAAIVVWRRRPWGDESVRWLLAAAAIMFWTDACRTFAHAFWGGIIAALSLPLLVGLLLAIKYPRRRMIAAGMLVGVGLLPLIGAGLCFGAFAVFGR